LANVRQHAWASTVTVELLDIEEGCLVRVVDDGAGYDPADVEDRPGHLGLALIRERAELAGGWCRIESSPGSGTTVEFWVPFGESSTEPEPGHELAG
jgi:signal transduction histidine kinase